MIFILATVSALWGYSLMMSIILAAIILYACMAYKVKQKEL